MPVNKLSQWLLTIGVGVVFFIFFLFWLFPFNVLIQHYLSMVEKNSGGVYRLSVGEIDPGILFKTVLKDFKVYHKEAVGESLWVDFKELRVGIKYFPLIAGQLNAAFEAKAKTGSVSGLFSFSTSEIHVEADFDSLKITEVPVLVNALGVPLKGSVSGNINFTADTAQVIRGEGRVNLQLKEVVLGPGNMTPYEGFDLTLPEIILSDSKTAGVVKLEMKDSQLTIKDINFSGEDFPFSLKGKIQLNKKSDLSRITANGNFKVSKKLEEAFPVITIIEKQKTEDGSYPLNISGRLTKPKVQIGAFNAL